MKNKNFFQSLKSSFRGIKDVMIFEQTFRKMTLAAAIVLFLMFYFPTTKTEKILLFVMIFAVLALELINSVIERIMDFIHAEHHTKVGDIKDLMAAVVLLVSIAAGVIGGIIFWPYIFS